MRARISLALLLGLSAALALRAEESALATVLARIEARSAEIHDFRARFRQEKSIYLLDRPIVSSGTVRFRRPGALRWETDAPERSVLVIDEKGMKVWLPGRKELEVYDLPGKDALGAILPLFGQSARDLARMYEVALGQGGTGEVVLVLVPRSERVRRAVARIEVALDAETLLPRRLVYADPNGDEARTTFEDVEINVGLGDADLALPPMPAGTETKKPLGGFPF